MCGRFTMTSTTEQIIDLFATGSVPNVEPHYNVAPTQDVLAARLNEDGEREAVAMRWGLVPFWADDPKIGSRMINARSESVHTKPAFREAFERRRCLVAADGFFEWRREGKQKQPYWIRLSSEEPFAFAGLWERWRAPDGDRLETCTILTTKPNELVRPLHDRMPVILHRADHALWLDADAGREAVARLFEPFPAEEMKAIAVSARVNSVTNDDPGCVEPVETQGSLL